MSNAFSVTELREQDPRVRVCDANLAYGEQRQLAWQRREALH